MVALCAVSGIVVVLASLPMGWLADRRRRAPVIGWAGLVFAVLVAVAGLATTTLTAFAARVGLGAAQADDLPVQGTLHGRPVRHAGPRPPVGLPVHGRPSGCGARPVRGGGGDHRRQRPPRLAVGVPGHRRAGRGGGGDRPAAPRTAAGPAGEPGPLRPRRARRARAAGPRCRPPPARPHPPRCGPRSSPWPPSGSACSRCRWWRRLLPRQHYGQGRLRAGPVPGRRGASPRWWPCPSPAGPTTASTAPTRSGPSACSGCSCSWPPCSPRCSTPCPTPCCSPSWASRRPPCWAPRS